MIYSIIVVVLAITGSISGLPDENKNIKYNYYWRQYLGEIPPDAIPGGRDASGTQTYIGQAFSTSKGLSSLCAIIPAEIHQGIPSVNIPIFGVKNATADIKILCGPNKSNFKFYTTDSNHLFSQFKHKHLIPGGNEDNGITHIGRVTYGSEIKIGKISTFKGPGEAKMFFVNHNAEVSSDVYEILVYEDDTAKALK